MVAPSVQLGVERNHLEVAIIVTGVHKDRRRSVEAVAVSRTGEHRDQQTRVVEPVAIHLQFMCSDHMGQAIVSHKVAQRLLGEVVRGRAAQIVGEASVVGVVVQLAHLAVLFVGDWVRP